jgi:hypothetical protein
MKRRTGWPGMLFTWMLTFSNGSPFSIYWVCVRLTSSIASQAVAKGVESLASIEDAAMRDAAIHYSRLALARAENVLELPEDLEIVRKLAKFASSR